MPLSTILILTYIVSMFAAFMIALGGVWLQQLVIERRERRAARIATLKPHRATLRAA